MISGPCRKRRISRPGEECGRFVRLNHTSRRHQLTYFIMALVHIMLENYPSFAVRGFFLTTPGMHDSRWPFPPSSLRASHITSPFLRCLYFLYPFISRLESFSVVPLPRQLKPALSHCASITCVNSFASSKLTYSGAYIISHF